MMKNKFFALFVALRVYLKRFRRGFGKNKFRQQNGSNIAACRAASGFRRHSFD